MQDAGLIGQGESSGRPVFGWENATKTCGGHAEKPRDYPCRPRAPQRVGVRVIGFGLWSGLGLGWSEPTCKVEIDETRPAQSFAQDAPAHSGSQTFLCCDGS